MPRPSPPPTTRRKGPFEVLSPAGERQSALGPGRAPPPQEMVTGSSELGGKGGGHQSGLVEAAPQPPQPMQGNRGDDVDRAEQVRQALGQGPPQLTTQVVEPSELERQQRRVEGFLVGPAGEQTLVGRGPASASGAAISRGQLGRGELEPTDLAAVVPPDPESRAAAVAQTQRSSRDRYRLATG